MPKGQSPSSLMKARYESLNAQLDRAERDLKSGAFNKVKRQITSLFKSEAAMQDADEAKKSGQRTLPAGHYKLLRRVRKIEANMQRQENMAEKVKKDQMP
jgi:hypothetical protein